LQHGLHYDRGELVAVPFDGLLQNSDPGVHRGVVGDQGPAHECGGRWAGQEHLLRDQRRKRRVHPVDRVADAHRRDRDLDPRETALGLVAIGASFS
jgi:hypothetical protein